MMTQKLIPILFSVLLMACGSSTSQETQAVEADDGCFIGGCSGQLCADEPLASTCEWHESYACFADATCERQENGQCGWTETEELTTCLAGSNHDCPGGDDGGSGDDDQPVGQDCGGFAGLQCPDGQYCAWSDDDPVCGIADHLGTCMPKPDACIEIWDPVCGCDGQTYSNACHANLAGQDVASPGEC